ARSRERARARNRLRTANAHTQRMPRARRPFRCRRCGFVTTPVSGFCPNCLERLPLGAGPWALLLVLGLVRAGSIAFGALGFVAPVSALRERPSPSAPTRCAEAAAGGAGEG